MPIHIKKACDHLKEKYALTGTERHIIYLIAIGHSPQEIATIRDRSLETVRTQIKHLMHKIGVKRLNSVVIEVFRYVDKI
jgi:DNA-binding CsgD family transcriptional regulator